MVITKSKFKEIEEILFKHFITLKKLKYLEQRSLVLFKQKEDIESDISSSNVKIYADIKAVNYDGGCIQSNSTGSYIEKSLEKEIEKLEEERGEIIKELLKTYTAIREMEKETFEINYILGMLREECRRIVQLKYDDNKSFDEIAEELNMSKSTAVRENKKIILTIEKFLYK